MNTTLLKALVGLLPASLLFSGSAVLFRRGRTVYALLQLIAAGCLVLVVLAHIAEALHLFPRMHWGLENSVGHYVDLWSVVLALTLFPIGYLLQALSLRKSTGPLPPAFSRSEEAGGTHDGHNVLRGQQPRH
jgi:hypothetical protein